MKAIRYSILIIDNSRGTTGAFKSIWELTKSLRDQFDFHFALRSGSSVAEEVRSARIPLLELPFLEIQKNWTLLFYFPVLVVNTLRILNYCRRNEIRIIHVNDLYNMCGVLVKILNGSVRLVYHVRLLPTSYAKRLFGVWRKLVLRHADTILAVSASVKGSLDPAPPGKVQVLYDFIPIPSQQGVFHRSDAMTFLYPANYIKGKGHLLALEAFRKLNEVRQDCRLRFVGGDLGLSKNKRWRGILQQKVMQSNLQDKVQVEGMAADVAGLMASADAILVFSESESFSMVCFEAMMMGRPVVATDCGGPTELIENGRTGLIIPNRDVQAMTQAMNLLASDPQLCERLGNQAHEDIIRRVDDYQAPSRLAGVYRQAG